MVGEKNLASAEEQKTSNTAENTPLHILVKEALEKLAKESSLDATGHLKSKDIVQNLVPENSSNQLASLIQNSIKTNNGASQSVRIERRKITSCQTKADGNCFFHAVFGFKNTNGQYETTRAKEMRQEWHNLLSQFHSLKDENMSCDLKDQLKKIFTMFLNDPSYLTGRSDLINNLVNETNQKIRHSDVQVEKLKNDIVNKFCENKMFRKEIMDVICVVENSDLIEGELLRDQKRLKNRISECLEECALKLYPHLSKSQCQEMYNSQTIADLFLEDSNVYRNYIDAIVNQEYFIFFEEIPILASLGNIKITIYRYTANDKTVFEPNLQILGNYKPDLTIWGKGQEVTIFHAGMHFSRAEITSCEVPQHFQLGSFPYQDSRKNVAGEIKTQENIPEKFPVEQSSISANREEDDLLSPLSTALKFDTNLHLGRENLHQMLSSLMKTNKLTQTNKLEIDAFPNAYELAQLSLKVYTEKTKNESDDDYEKKLDLPPGWKLLTTATNRHLNNGYFGAAFVNAGKRHVVIAHRGTKLENLGSWWTNVKGVVFDNCPARMSSAVTFVDRVIGALDDVPATALAITGHSLGGWLAQITCFTAMYLRGRESHFAKNTQSQAVHAQTVAFDSPGCRGMLLKLQKDYDLRYDTTMSLDALHIVNYLSAPNRVNTYKLHFGTLYRIFPDFSDMGFLEKHSAKYTYATHSMSKIAAAFVEETGSVGRDKDGRLKIQEVADWPVSGAFRRGDEYKSFFNWATFFNDYHPEEKNEMFTSDLRTVWRYRTKKIDATACSLGVFAPNELLFLESWLTMKQGNIKLDKLQEFTTAHKLGDCKDLLPHFVIDKNTHKVQCACLTTLINRTKQLLRWLSSELTTAVKEQLALLPSAAESMFIVESKSFLDSMIRCNVDFEDIGIGKFFKSDTQRLLSITTPDIEFEVVRVYKVCERIQNELKYAELVQKQNSAIENCHIIVLSWKQIASLEKFVDVTSILTSKADAGDLLILTFQGQSQISEDDKIILNSILSVIHRSKHCKKVIFVHSKRSSLNKYITSRIMLEGFVQKDMGPISFSDLRHESQIIILQKPLIMLRETQYSLNQLFNISNAVDSSILIRHLSEVIDSSLFKNLIDENMEVFKVQNEFIELYDEEVFYSKIFKDVSTQCAVKFMLNVNVILHDITKPVVFFISGLPEGVINSGELPKRLNVTDPRNIDKIKSAIGSTIIINADEEHKELRFKQFCRDSPGKRVYWLEVRNGYVRWQHVYDNDFYISRNFNDQITLKKDIIDLLIEDSYPDFFIFSNCSRKSLVDVFATSEEKQKMFSKCKNFLPISEEGAYSKFEEMKRYDKPIHLIRVDETTKKLIWQTSSGTLDNIRDYTETDNISINERNFLEKSNRVVILSGDPGMGKSTTIYNLSKNIKSSWVIHKDLRNYQSLNIDPSSKIDINYVVSFLLNHECDDIAAVLLKECLIQKDAIPVVLIFDGFDEIKKDPLQNRKFGNKEQETTQENVIQLLGYLREKTRANIWITSRKFQSKILENQFSIFATSFEKLMDDQLKQFLKKFWMARLGIELNENIETKEKVLEQYLERLFADAKNMLGKEISKFMCVPLHMRMIAEVAQPEIDLFSDSTSVRSVVTGEINNIFDLYQQFIEAKYDIYLHEKSGLASGLTDANRSWFIEVLNKKHRSLSFQLLFPDDAKDFLGKNQVHLNEDFMSEEEMELNRVGLIQSTANGTFDFIHRTFAEFFVAELFICWLSKSQGRHQKYPGIEEFLVSKILLHPDYKVVRLFLNYHLSIHELPMEALKFYAQRFTKLWNDRRQIFFNKNLQTALHVVSTENCGELVEFILAILDPKYLIQSYIIVDTSALIAARDKLGRTALYMASEYNSNNAITKFIQYIKSSPESVQQRLILSSIYRKYEDKDDPHIHYLLAFITSEGGSKMISISQNIQSKWELIIPFLSAAKRNDVHEVQRLADAYRDQNSRFYFLACSDKTGKTALHLASEHGGMETVEYLVKEKVLLDAVDAEGMTPLLHAARSGFLNVVQLLHRQGADIKAADNYNMTALAWSSKTGHSKIVEYLFHQGVDVNVADRNGISPAQHAAKSGHLEILKYLANHGANIYVFDKFGMCALSWAARSGHVDVVDYLVQQSVNIDCQDRYGMSALQIAIKANKWDVVTYLVTHGADTSSCDWNGMTALQRVIKAGKWSVAKYLVTQGASLGDKDWKGNHALYPLVKANKWDMVMGLVERGASIAELTSEEKRMFLQQVIGRAAFHEGNNHQAFYRVIRLGNVELLELLIGEKGLKDISKSQDLALILSKSYDELKLKNVPISSEMQFFVESKLIQHRFFSERNAQKNDFSLEEIKDIIVMVCENVCDLNTNYSGNQEIKMDATFIHRATAVAKNIHILKRYLKSSYSKLPWEEMEFCLLSFVSTVLNPKGTDEICKLFLDQSVILRHLVLFSEKLEEVKNSLQKKDITGKGKLPARNTIIKNILNANPGFEGLYEDYNVVRNVYSLNKIDSYIKLSVSVDLDKYRELGKFVIERTLQVLGECLKNTAESPNVTDDVHIRLLDSAPRQLKETVTTLRDALSHADSLTKMIALEDSKNAEFFRNVQNDLIKIGSETTNILHRKKIDAFKIFLKKIINCKAEEFPCLIRRMNNSDCVNINYIELHCKELDKLKELMNEIQSKVHEIPDTNKQLLEKINTIIEKETSRLIQTNKDYRQRIKDARFFINESFNFKNVRNYARECLESFEVDENGMKEVLPLMKEFYLNLPKSDLSKEVAFLCYKMFAVMEFEAKRIQVIDEIKEHLNKEDEESDDIENRLMETFDKIESKLKSDPDKKKFREEVLSRTNIHKSKEKRMHYFDNSSEKMDETMFDELSKCLNLKPRIKKELKEKYDEGDLKTCLSLTKKIDDKYSDLIKTVTDLSFFALEKYNDAFKTFFSVDKKFKCIVDNAIDEVGQEVLKVTSFFRQRMSVLEELLKVQGLEAQKEVAMEILLLELTEILEHASLLKDNKLFLFDCSPVLVGKSFRNYLAHGNVLVDLLPCSPSISKVTHAQQLIENGAELLTRKDRAIGQQNMVDVDEIKERNRQQLKVIVAQKKMFHAAKKGDLKEVRECIEEGADTKSKALNGYTCMEFATIADSVEVLKFLIDETMTLDIKKTLGIAVSHGSIKVIKYICEDLLLNVNSIHIKRDNLVHLLASKGHKNVLDFFISRGANVCALDEDNFSPLHFASKNGHKEIVRLLLEKGKDVNGGSRRESPLIFAITEGRSDVVRLLLEHGADVNQKGAYSWTPLHHASFFGHANVVRELLAKRPFINAVDDDKNPPLYWALQEGHNEVALILLNSGADFHFKNESNESFLHLASKNGLKNVVVLLLNKGMNVKDKTINNCTPLHFAAKGGHAAVADTLLSRGANIEEKVADRDWTALHLAVKFGHESVVETLLRHNGNVHCLCADNSTLLHVAAMNGHETIAKDLIRRGVDVNAKTTQKRTPLHFACQQGHNGVVRLLLDEGADVNALANEDVSSLHVAAMNKRDDVVLQLLERGATVDAGTSNGVTALYVASGQGSDETVKTLLTFGANVNYKDASLRTPLHVAAERGHKKVAEKLLSSGAELNAADAANMTPLHEAVSHGHKDVVEFLLSKPEVDVNAASQSNETPLHIAAENCFSDIVTLLLQKNADVHGLRETPLYLAALHGSKDIVSELLKFGAEVDRSNVRHFTPLLAAVENNRRDVVAVLLEHHADVNAKRKDGVTPLLLAAGLGYEELACDLVESGADVNAKGSENTTPLLCAARANRMRLARQLLDRGADASARTQDNFTATEIAAIKGHEDMVALLLEHRTDGSEREKEAEMLMRLAVRFGQVGVVSRLLSLGVEVDAAGADLCTALHLAALHGRAGVAAVLLDNGANVDARDQHNWSPVHVAANNGNQEVVELLLQRGADPNSKNHRRPATGGSGDASAAAPAVRTECPYGATALHFAAYKGHGPVLEALLQRGAHVDATDENSCTALHVAASDGRNHVAHLLLAYNADVAATDANGFTALHVAAFNGHTDVAVTLLENGADANARSADARTPAHLAAYHGSTVVLEHLLEKGADVDPKDKDYWTPLHFAAFHGHKQVVAWLVKHGAEVNAKERDDATPLLLAVFNGHEDVAATLLDRGADANATDNDGLTPLLAALERGFVTTVQQLLDHGADVNVVDARGRRPLDIAMQKSESDERYGLIAAILMSVSE